MIVVADSSPLIVLAKVNCFNHLNRLFPRLYITPEVQNEVVVSGAGLPGAAEVANATWIEVKQLENQTGLQSAAEEHSLGIGELSTILLGKEMQANEVLVDDFSARRLARSEGLFVRGTLGLLETFYLQGYVTDLRTVFQSLKAHSYIDQRLLDLRLRALRLPQL